MGLPVLQNSGVSCIGNILASHEQLSCVKSTALSQLLRLDHHTKVCEVTEVCSSSVIGGTTYTEPNIASIRHYYFVSLTRSKNVPPSRSEFCVI